jgi:hypothetical protein
MAIGSRLLPRTFVTRQVEAEFTKIVHRQADIGLRRVSGAMPEKIADPLERYRSAHHADRPRESERVCAMAARWLDSGIQQTPPHNGGEGGWAGKGLERSMNSQEHFPCRCLGAAVLQVVQNRVGDRFHQRQRRLESGLRVADLDPFASPIDVA